MGTGRELHAVQGASGRDDGAAAERAAPSSAPPAAAPPVISTSRPWGYREPPTTTLSRIHDRHPDWAVVDVRGGYRATRGTGPGAETVFARTPLGLEARLDGLA